MATRIITNRAPLGAAAFHAKEVCVNPDSGVQS